MLLAIVVNAAVENRDCECTAVARIALKSRELFCCLWILFEPWKAPSFTSASAVSSFLLVVGASVSSEFVIGQANPVRGV